jgi:hypothetical protein
MRLTGRPFVPNSEKELKHNYGRYDCHYEPDESIDIGHDLTTSLTVLLKSRRGPNGAGHP